MVELKRTTSDNNDRDTGSLYYKANDMMCQEGWLVSKVIKNASWQTMRHPCTKMELWEISRFSDWLSSSEITRGGNLLQIYKWDQGKLIMLAQGSWQIARGGATKSMSSKVPKLPGNLWCKESWGPLFIGWPVERRKEYWCPMTSMINLESPS
jgi:hypothetical protein